MRLRRLSAVVTGLAALVLLGGCASTEELYADYDELVCAKAAPVCLNMVTATAVLGTPWHMAVYFGLDRDDLKAQELKKLQQNLAILQAHEGLKVVVRGFTDSIATTTYNLDLGKRRARTVADYFKQHGIQQRRVIIQDNFGEAFPVLDNTSEDKRAVNRRTEMLLMDRDGRILSVFFDASEVKAAKDNATGGQQ